MRFCRSPHRTVIIIQKVLASGLGGGIGIGFRIGGGNGDIGIRIGIGGNGIGVHAGGVGGTRIGFSSGLGCGLGCGFGNPVGSAITLNSGPGTTSVHETVEGTDDGVEVVAEFGFREGG